MPDIDYIVSTRKLSKRFDTRVATEKGWEKRTVAAVSNVSLDIAPGETLGLVGESGCGKTTLGRLLALFYEPSDGTITLQGVDVGKLKPRDIKSMRQQVQMVFQDPMSSLNPRHTIESILTEPMKIFGRDRASVRREKAGELLESVGLSAKNLGKYPHEFSGGQRQRITIARALVLNPAFVVADEPVSALDVSVQSQILNLLQDIKQEFHLTYLFISHDLAVVHHLADRVAVMYLGRIVEIADRETLFRDARHPYTQSLLSSVPTRHTQMLCVDEPPRRELRSVRTARCSLSGLHSMARAAPEPRAVESNCRRVSREPSLHMVVLLSRILVCEGSYCATFHTAFSAIENDPIIFSSR